MAHPRGLGSQNQWSGGVQRFIQAAGLQRLHANTSQRNFFSSFFQSSASKEREDAPWSTAACHSPLRMGRPVYLLSGCAEAGSGRHWRVNIYIEDDHYGTLAFRMYGHFYTRHSPERTPLRWEDGPHAGDTRFLLTVSLLALWEKKEIEVNML